MWACFPLTEAPFDFHPQVTDINRQQNGSDNPTAHRTLEGKALFNVNTQLGLISRSCFWTSLYATHMHFQITVYDQEHFQGKRMEFTASCQNIIECGMDNIRSLKVECGA